MIGRGVIVKLVVFTLVTLLGVGYVAVHYLGLARAIVGDSYTAYVDLSESGGLFPSASVTYRGVEAGRVGTIELRDDGIRVALNMTGEHDIPTNTRAVIGNGSAIGEQYLDLQPEQSGGPFLKQGSVIPVAMTEIPVSTQQLLVSVDELVNSLPRQDLRTMVNELGAAFEGTGPSLRRLIDASQSLLTTAEANLPDTVGLINESEPVLQTQVSLRGELESFSRDLASFTDQLRASDADLRKILRDGPPAARELRKMSKSLDVALPALLRDLVTFGRPVTKRIPALRQVLLGYPYVIASTFGIFPGGGLRFGIPVFGDNQVAPCNQGYIGGSNHRLPSELSYPPLRWKATCLAPTNQPMGVRGSRQAPLPNGERLGDQKRYQNAVGLPRSNFGPSSPEVSNEESRDALNYAGVLASNAGSGRWGDNTWRYLILGPLM